MNLTHPKKKKLISLPNFKSSSSSDSSKVVCGSKIIQEYQACVAEQEKNAKELRDASGMKILV